MKLRNINYQLTWEVTVFFLALALLRWPQMWLIIITAAIVALGLMVKWMNQTLDIMSVSMFGDDMETKMPEEPAVDPWEYQRRLMEMSDQRIPHGFRLHTGVLLYGALIMEETAETYQGISTALQAGAKDDDSYSLAIATNFGNAAVSLLSWSKVIRGLLEHADVDFPLTEDCAVELFDGTTDIAVVNSGFALSCGFPGAAGYREVVGSNISKANPETGKIDKDPGGKWIKGPDFYKPDLMRVLYDESYR